MQVGNVLDRETGNMVSFITFIIFEFGESYKMGKREAYLYLKKYGGLDFIYEHWWALHTDNPYYAVRDIFDVCRNNGGRI
ncbi:MAG: DUF3791 domain-containing protein [Chitinispirillales bacterium]|jgi:hypothetical protein|nr:DUF3791 domain-containing protein [Chitinispirillales bacterium]